MDREIIQLKRIIAMLMLKTGLRKVEISEIFMRDIQDVELIVTHDSARLLTTIELGDKLLEDPIIISGGSTHKTRIPSS